MRTKVPTYRTYDTALRYDTLRYGVTIRRYDTALRYGVTIRCYDTVLRYGVTTRRVTMRRVTILRVTIRRVTIRRVTIRCVTTRRYDTALRTYARWKQAFCSHESPSLFNIKRPLSKHLLDHFWAYRAENRSISSKKLLAIVWRGPFLSKTSKS